MTLENEILILWLAVISFVLAGTLAVIAVLFKRRPEQIILGLMSVGFILLTAAITMRWMRLGHGPYLTMFEILLSNVWSFSLVFIIAYWRIRLIRPIAAVIMPIMFIMLGWMMLQHKGEGHMPASYKTIWLYIHIGLGKVFLGATLVAVGIAGVILLRYAGAKRLFSRMPSNTSLDELAYRFMSVGLVFDTLMLMTGAIWAQDAWGRYWAWDPLETWAFITWLFLAFAIHARLTLKPLPVYSATMVIIVFVLGFLTFFGIPFISAVPHQGMV